MTPAMVLAAVGIGGAVVAIHNAFRRTLGSRLPRPASDQGHTPSTEVLSRLGRTDLGVRLAGPRVRSALTGAGWAVEPSRFAGLRLVAGGAGVLVGLAVPFPGPLLAPFLAVVGARLPLFLTARAARRRRVAMDAEIPQLLDLLAAGSSAGLAAPLALRRSIDGLRGPLATELGRTLDAVDLGARWRDELRALADRSQLPDLTRAVAAVTRTESLGSSLAESTRELAATVRASRRAAVTERARTAPVKMLFPLVFLVLPAFLLLTVVPVLLTTLQSIR
jgi:Flp pilus assembly protein TadB